MNKCPRCGMALIRVRYEHRPVHQCRQCLGHLLSNWKLERDLDRAKGPPWLADDVLDGVLNGLLRMILRGLPVGRLR